MPVQNVHLQKPHATATAAVLNLARKLHRAATAGSVAASLPVLRRVLATGTLRGLSLPELHRSRCMVQRKHILRTLALEAGFHSWEHYKPALEGMATAQLAHFDLVRTQAGYPNAWFASLAEAEQHASLQGGQVMQVGQQAVVIQELTAS